MGKFGVFVAGGIVGAALGMLCTPRNGAENREVLADKINENWSGAPQAKEQFDAFTAQAAATTTQVVNTVIDKGSETVKSVTNRGTEAVSAVEPAFSEKNDELREKIDAARERIATQVAKNAEAAHDAATGEAAAE